MFLPIYRADAAKLFLVSLLVTGSVGYGLSPERISQANELVSRGFAVEWYMLTVDSVSIGLILNFVVDEQDLWPSVIAQNRTMYRIYEAGGLKAFKHMAANPGDWLACSFLLDERDTLRLWDATLQLVYGDSVYSSLEYVTMDALGFDLFTGNDVIRLPSDGVIETPGMKCPIVWFRFPHRSIRTRARSPNGYNYLLKVPDSVVVVNRYPR